MAKKETNEVTVTQSTAVPTVQAQVPTHGALDQSDITIPRLQLLQALSDAVSEDLGKQGEFMNSVTSENYGKEVLFIPLISRESEIIKGKALFEDRALKCRSSNRIEGIGEPGGYCPECPNAKFGDDNEAPKCSDQYVYLAYVVGSDDDLPVAVILSKTGLKEARIFNTLLKGGFNAVAKGKKPAFGTVYSLSAIKKKFAKGEAFVPKVKKLREASGEEAVAAQEMYDSFSGVNVEVDMSSGTNEFSAGATEESFV